MVLKTLEPRFFMEEPALVAGPMDHSEIRPDAPQFIPSLKKSFSNLRKKFGLVDRKFR